MNKLNPTAKLITVAVNNYLGKELLTVKESKMFQLIFQTDGYKLYSYQYGDLTIFVWIEETELGTYVKKIETVNCQTQ